MPGAEVVQRHPNAQGLYLGQHLTSLPHVSRVHSSFALRTVQKSRALPLR